MTNKITTALGRPSQTIAVFRALKIGDLLCAVPAFRALRRAFPAAKITLVGLPWAQEFVARFSHYFDEFIWFPGYPGLPEQPIDPVKILTFLQARQARPFDVVLQMQGNGTIVNSLLLLWNGKLTAGYYPLAHAEQYCPDPNFFMPYPATEHEVKRHVQLLEFLGLPAQGYDLEFPVTAVDIARAAALPEWPELLARPYVCLHPGGISARRWPVPHFAQVADALAAQGFTVVLTGTEPEKATVAAVQEHMRHPAIHLAGRTDLGALAAVLQRTALLVSNDTGVSHVAAALRVPSVVIYTTSKPAEWAPLNQQLHRVVLEVEADVPRVLAEAAAVLRERVGLE